MKDDLVRLEKSLDKMNEKVDKICNGMSEMNTTLAVNTRELETHIKRSELLEARVDKMDAHFNKILGAFILLQFAIPLILKFVL